MRERAGARGDRSQNVADSKEKDFSVDSKELTMTKYV